MAEPFRVAISGDFKKQDGSPTFPDFDLEPLRTAPGVEMEFLESVSPLRADQLEDFDALILLIHRFAAESVPKSGRLALVARFGVGYDIIVADGPFYRGQNRGCLIHIVAFLHQPPHHQHQRQTGKALIARDRPNLADRYSVHIHA